MEGITSEHADLRQCSVYGIGVLAAKVGPTCYLGRWLKKHHFGGVIWVRGGTHCMHHLQPTCGPGLLPLLWCVLLCCCPHVPDILAAAADARSSGPCCCHISVMPCDRHGHPFLWRLLPWRRPQRRSGLTCRMPWPASGLWSVQLMPRVSGGLMAFIGLPTCICRVQLRNAGNARGAGHPRHARTGAVIDIVRQPPLLCRRGQRDGDRQCSVSPGQDP